MSLRDLIEKKYRESIKSKDINSANVFRLIKSAIKDKDIENRSKNSSNEINEKQILALLQNLVKQRKDSIESFKMASRDDLVKKEESEIDLINQFLPKQMNEEETKIILEKIINEQNISTIKDMGKLMNFLKENYSGSIDMAIAGKMAKSLLGN